MNVSNFLRTRYHSGPNGYERFCGKNTRRLLSEAGIGDMKISVRAPLK